MSINHFSSDIPAETLWWQQQQQHQQEQEQQEIHIMDQTQNTPSSKHNSSLTPPPPPPPPPHLHHHHHLNHHVWLNSTFPTQNPHLNFNLNQHDNLEQHPDDQFPSSSHHHDQEIHQQQEEDEEEEEPEKEPMFEKPLTPSDVGKLNRLVIPKQHAEKYFPIGGGDSVDKGLLLSFEDELGKCWRFRYSYWNSSQSYVLTKGWSRYVKEKRLDAGDVVLFERHRSDSERLFIGWRRRGAAVGQEGGGGSGWSRGLFSGHPYPRHIEGHGANVPYQPDCLHAGSMVTQNQTQTVGSSSRTLRLFGVNLECQLDESEPSTPDGSSLSSQGPAPHHHFFSQSYSSNHHNHMDITFSRDVNQQMINRRG